jgi:hypothetical protein
MGDRTFSNISSALATLLDDKVVNQINRATVLPQLMTTRRRMPVRTSHGSRSSAPPRARRLPTAPMSLHTTTTTRFRRACRSPCTPTRSRSRASRCRSRATRATPPDLVNLFGDEMGDSVERLAKGVAKGIYSGTGTGGAMMGLRDATAGAILATGTYANINRSTYPQWASNVDSNGGVGRALSFALMRNDAPRRSTRRPARQTDLIVTTPALFGKYGDLFGHEPHVRAGRLLRGGKITLSGGHQALLFDGIPIVQDVLCPAGEMLCG